MFGKWKALVLDRSSGMVDAVCAMPKDEQACFIDRTEKHVADMVRSTERALNGYKQVEQQTHKADGVVLGMLRKVAPGIVAYMNRSVMPQHSDQTGAD